MAALAHSFLDEPVQPRCRPISWAAIGQSGGALVDAHRVHQPGRGCRAQRPTRRGARTAQRATTGSGGKSRMLNNSQPTTDQRVEECSKPHRRWTRRPFSTAETAAWLMKLSLAHQPARTARDRQRDGTPPHPWRSVRNQRACTRTASTPAPPSTIIWLARRARSTLVADMHTISRNRREERLGGWLNTSWVRYHVRGRRRPMSVIGHSTGATGYDRTAAAGRPD